MQASARRASVLLASLAAAWLAAACAQDGPTAAIPGAPALDVIAPEDSVCAGYGSGSTGGLEYECFEYDPDTCTEYVVCPDTTNPPPPPAPPPAPPAPTQP